MMARRDYICCKSCGCKLVYDGYDSIRDSLNDEYGTVDLICPSCLDALEVKLAELEQSTAVDVVQCEPKHAVTKDGYSQWECPKPTGYLMQCCDCGLVHEVDFRVVRYAPRPSEEFTIIEDENIQAQFRMRRYNK